MENKKGKLKYDWETLIFLFSGIITVITVWMGRDLFSIILSLAILTVVSVFYNVKIKNSVVNWFSTFFIFIYTVMALMASFGKFTIDNYASLGIILGIGLILLMFYNLLNKKEDKNHNKIPKLIFSYLFIALLIINSFAMIYSSNQDISYNNEPLGERYSAFDYVYFSTQTFYLTGYGDFTPIKTSRAWVLLEFFVTVLFHLLIIESYLSKSKIKN